MGQIQREIEAISEILVVEDSPTQAMQLEYILAQAQYRVSAVRNGREALTWLSHHKPSLIISDIVMPEMDGYELCRQIKATKGLRTVPVILLTSLSDAGDVFEGLCCNADGFIIKPYDRQNLLTQVSRALTNGCPEDEAEASFEADFAGNTCVIQSSRKKILEMLLSTYETAVRKNLELIQTQNELRVLNEQLEEKVKERTAALTVEVAERRRAEDSLRLSEEKYRELVENASSSIMRLDAEGRITFFNEFAQRFFGYSEEEILGQKAFGTIFPFTDASGNDLSALFRDVLKNPNRYQNLESENLRRNGDRVWVVWTNKAMFDQHGTLCGILSVGNDITERKRADELMRVDEARFIALIQLSRMRDATSKEIAEFTLEQAVRVSGSKIGFIGYLNEDESVFTVHARSEGIMSQCDIAEDTLHFPVKDAGLWAESVRKRSVFIINDYSVVTPEHKGYPQGHVPLTRLLTVPVFDRDRIVALVAVANKHGGYDSSDVRQLTLLLDGMWKLAQHKMAEDALRLSEAQLRSSNVILQEVFDGISDPLIMLDDKLLVKVINKAAKAYYGLTEGDDVYGRPCYAALRRSSSPCTDCNYPFMAQNGHRVLFERRGAMDPERYEQVVVYPLLNEEGERDAAIIRISDITQAKLMERQLVQSEKLAALGLLVSGVAHEINNPNSFMTFNIPILRDYLHQLMPIVDGYANEHPDFELFCMKYDEFRQDIFKLLDNMEHGASRINTIVSNLKEYVRKRDRAELTWTDLKAVIDKAVNMCHAEIRKNIKSFEVHVTDDIPLIFSDPEGLEQVILNLLINAVHASDKPDSWIRISAKCDVTREPSCLIEVSDNGCGIEDKAKTKIFDPFYTTKASSSGTGLGLYVCYNLVEALGGEIEVDSKPGLGSTFRIILRGIQQRKREKAKAD